MALPTNLDTMSNAERQAYHDAYGIACVGASNPAGVALTIHKTLAALYRDGYDTKRAAYFEPVQAMVGQLAYLTGLSLGPEFSLLADIHTVYLMGQTMPREDVFPVGNPGRPE